MLISLAPVVLMALMPGTSALWHTLIYNGEQIDHRAVVRGSVYDFTVCTKGCKRNFCSGDEVRYVGDYPVNAIPDPGTQCIVLNPGPPNVLTQRVSYGKEIDEYCLPVVDDSVRFTTCRRKEINDNVGTFFCWIKSNLFDDKPIYRSIRVDDEGYRPYATGELVLC